MRRAGAAAVVLMAVFAAGCASVPVPPDAGDGPEAACLAFFYQLDAATEEAGVRDGIGAPPSRFPYLRSTRFLQSFVPELQDPAVREDWLDAVQATDRKARSFELRHLEHDRVGDIPLPRDARSAGDAVNICGDRLRRADRLDAADGPWQDAAAALAVDDEYITWHRAVGLYPVSRWFIRSGVATWQRGVRNSFENRLPAAAPGLRYHPAAGDARPAAAGEIIAGARTDALGWPQLTANQWLQVFGHYAPVVETETDASYNRLGRPGLDAGGLPVVDTDAPVMYAHAAGMRYGDETLVQLNYTWWFTERPLDHWFDLLGGRLDGLTLRFTLDGTGELLLVETMHICGCYHQHYPVNGLVARDDPDYAEPPLILPGPGRPERGERLHVRLEDGSHYVLHLAFAPVRGEAERYRFAHYDQLRSVATADRGRRSLFGADGLVPGTERNERWFFWVSGVPEAGAMRQYHRHATAFVGRRHFDDPDLLERIYSRER